MLACVCFFLSLLDVGLRLLFLSPLDVGLRLLSRLLLASGLRLFILCFLFGRLSLRVACLPCVRGSSDSENKEQHSRANEIDCFHENSSIWSFVGAVFRYRGFQAVVSVLFPGGCAYY